MNLAARILFWALDRHTESCTKKPYGSIYMTITAPYTPGEKIPEAALRLHSEPEKIIGRSVRTTCRPAEDYRIMQSALELVQAVQLRNVDVSPWKLFERLVGYDYNEALRRQAGGKV